MWNNKVPNESTKNDDELNIFEDFNSNEDLKKEIEELKEEKKRDFFFYAIHTWSLLKVMNLMLFLFFSVLYVYFYLQDKEDLFDSQILNPVCSYFLWDINSWDVSCSSVTHAINKAQAENNTLKNNQFTSVVKVVPNVYSSLNWFEWEEITFLLSKTKNRLRPMEIIEEFDILKNSFETDDKKKITCVDLRIDNEYKLSAKCSALSRWYETKIVWYDWSKWENVLVSGTSASIAASFLNYIKKKSKWKFILIDQQREFSSIDDIQDWYTKKTNFDLKLQYNSDNLLINK